MLCSSWYAFTENNKLIGFVTKSDTDFVNDENIELRNIMTPYSKLLVGKNIYNLEHIDMCH